MSEPNGTPPPDAQAPAEPASSTPPEAPPATAPGTSPFGRPNLDVVPLSQGPFDRRSGKSRD
jgi:hypothetical protein